MFDLIYVTKEHYKKAAVKIKKMQMDLAEIRKNKKDAYENCGDGWHDNPFYNHLKQEERMTERRLSDEIASFSKYSIFDATTVPSNPISVSLGTKVRVLEQNLRTGTAKERYLRIVPLGDEEEKDAFLYYTPRIRPLLGAKAGETRLIEIPIATLHVQILSIEKDIDRNPKCVQHKDISKNISLEENSRNC